MADFHLNGFDDEAFFFGFGVALVEKEWKIYKDFLHFLKLMD